MNNLFRKKNTDVGGYVPPTLVNLSLIGNKVKQFFVVRANSLVPRDRNELVIPYYPTTENYNEERLLRIAITKMKLFRDMKFRTKDLDILHIAQFLFANRYLKTADSKLADTLSKANGFDSPYRYEQFLRDKVINNVPLNKNEAKFWSTRHDIAPFSKASTDAVWKKVIDSVLKGTPVQEVYLTFVRETGFATVPHREKEELAEFIRTKLQLRYPIGAKVPEGVVLTDVNRVYNLIDLFYDNVANAKRYMRTVSMSGKSYFDKDYEWTDYGGETRKGKWLYRKLSQQQIRSRVNRLVELLSRIQYTYFFNSTNIDGDGQIVLSGEEYLEQLKEYDKIADENESLELPDGISDELADAIMESAEKDFQRHLIDYWSDPNGVHGKAIIKKFTPTNTIHKAVRQIAKRNSDRGVVPKNMYRMTTDKKVFTNKTSVLGGSLMIDFSGSMGMSEEDAREIIDYLPAANIAGYVGYGYPIDGYDGAIQIIAKDGRIDTNAISNLKEWGQNSVDLDALKWLAEQPEPRIWVSDQQVVGVNQDDRRSQNLNKEARLEIASFMKRHNIIPIRVIEQVKEVAKQLAK
jgi:hypothetical protein